MADRLDRSGLLDGSVPTMFVGASHDVVVPADVMRKFADAIPHDRFEVVQDCGHMLPLERPDALARLLTECMEAALSQPNSQVPSPAVRAQLRTQQCPHACWTARRTGIP